MFFFYEILCKVPSGSPASYTYLKPTNALQKATKLDDFTVNGAHGKNQDEEIGKQEEVGNHQEVDEDDTSSANNSVVGEKLQSVTNSIQRLASSIRDGFSSRKNTSEESERQCPICICDFEIGDEICYSRNKKCPHMFHHSCMSEWLIKHNVCPLCRVDYLEVSDDTVEQTGGGLEHRNHTLTPVVNNDHGPNATSNRSSRTTAHVHLYAS